MHVEVEQLVGWNEALNAARNTVNALPREGEPSEKFKREILDAEHSPCRIPTYRVRMSGIPYWVSVHLVRHKHGVEHFVSTQRTDRTGKFRDVLPQDAPVNHTMVLNAQEFMFISRRRLCRTASVETRSVWSEVVRALREVDPVLADFCVPMCVYRGGFCHEAYGCGKCPPANVPGR